MSADFLLNALIMNTLLLKWKKRKRDCLKERVTSTNAWSYKHFTKAIHWSRALRNSINFYFLQLNQRRTASWELIQLLETYHVGRKNVWNRWKYTDSHVKTKRHFFCFRRVRACVKYPYKENPPETRRDWFRENKPMKHFVRIKAKFELKKGGRCDFWGLLLFDDRRFPCTVAVALTPSWLVRISPVSLQSNW